MYALRLVVGITTDAEEVMVGLLASVSTFLMRIQLETCDSRSQCQWQDMRQLLMTLRLRR